MCISKQATSAIVSYLAAEALGLGATGVGAFYDEEVHRYLNLNLDSNILLNGSVQKVRPVVCRDILVGRWRVKVPVVSNVEELDAKFEAKALDDFERFVTRGPTM
jgi:hypothetical protein